MISTRKRVISAAAATVIVGASTLFAAPTAQADGGYYGNWNLAAIKLGEKKQKCDGLPQDEDKCPAGMTLDLKANYRYASTIKGLEIILMPGKGDFVTATVPGTGSHVIVFNTDEYPTFLRVWKMTLKGTRSGAPQKMVLSGSFGENPDDPTDDAPIELVFRRDGK
jgi:hypothetical protein